MKEAMFIVMAFFFGVFASQIVQEESFKINEQLLIEKTHRLKQCEVEIDRMHRTLKEVMEEI
jgi:hypothetical protein